MRVPRWDEMYLRAHTRSSEVADTVESMSRALLERASWVPTELPELEKFIEQWTWRQHSSRVMAELGNQVPDIFWTGIYGVGVGARGDYEFPVVIANEELVERKQTKDVLRRAFDIQVPAELEYLGVQEPEPQAVSCRCGSRIGTFGVAVLTQAYTHARLTAGHVANPVGAHVVDEEGSVVGIVSFCEDPATAPASKMCADVAVIELPEQRSLSRDEYKGVGYGLAGDGVTMYGSRKTSETKLFCYTPWIAVPYLAGFWAHVYLTQTAISEPGDSGASVVLTESPNLPIGHVVGASRPATTYIQDLDFQLAISNTRLL
jgi:hypothetical protein